MKKGFAMITAASLLLGACSGGGKEADRKPDEAQTVVVATPVASSYLKEAAQKFEKLHPRIRVEIKEYFTAMKSKQDSTGQITQNVTLLEVEKYIQSITAQILSGKGSDLIATDFLPKDKFVKKKAFAHVGELMDQDPSFQKNDYYLIPSLQTNGGLYEVPVGFYPDGMLEGNKKLLSQAGIAVDDKTWTWERVSEWSSKLKEKAGPDTYAFLNIDPSFLITGDLKKYYANGGASFDSDAFRQAMNQIKALYDQKAIRLEDIGGNGAGTSKAAFSLADLSNPANALASLLQPETALYRKPSFTGQTGGIGYEGMEAYAINGKSEVKQEAWMFLSFLLSGDMQHSSELRGFPLHKAAARNAVQQARGQIETSSTPLPFPLPAAKTIDQAADTLLSLLDAAGAGGSPDLEITNIVTQEFAYFMNGQKNAAEVSKLIQNRVTTYLNE